MRQHRWQGRCGSLPQNADASTTGRVRCGACRSYARANTSATSRGGVCRKTTDAHTSGGVDCGARRSDPRTNTTAGGALWSASSEKNTSTGGRTDIGTRRRDAREMTTVGGAVKCGVERVMLARGTGLAVGRGGVIRAPTRVEGRVVERVAKSLTASTNGRVRCWTKRLDAHANTTAGMRCGVCHRDESLARAGGQTVG